MDAHAAELIKLPNGLFFFSMAHSETLFIYEEIFENHTYLGSELRLGSGDIVLDVGANIGLVCSVRSRRS
jgi:hypothetical protein